MTHTQDHRQTLILDLTEQGQRVAGERFAEDNLSLIGEQVSEIMHRPGLLASRVRGDTHTTETLEEMNR